MQHKCEGCPEPATTLDDYGTPLCDECFDLSFVPDAGPKES
jgi:hypothetical protein